MKRLPTTGASLATPKLGENDLKRVLAELGAAAVFDHAAVHDLYMKLAAIHGAWWAEQEAKQVSPVASALRRVGTGLKDIGALLSGHETGFQTRVTVETTSQTARMLARNPAIGSIKRAHELIDTFKKDAANTSLVYLVSLGTAAWQGNPPAAVHLLKRLSEFQGRVVLQTDWRLPRFGCAND